MSLTWSKADPAKLFCYMQLWHNRTMFQPETESNPLSQTLTTSTAPKSRLIFSTGIFSREHNPQPRLCLLETFFGVFRITNCLRKLLNVRSPHGRKFNEITPLVPFQQPHLISTSTRKVGHWWGSISCFLNA